jgi:hypothetical protein
VSNTPTEPTAEQCSKRERLPAFNGQQAFACWYPQMGGYSGKCVVVSEAGPFDLHQRDLPCFEVYVWHDGDFPFSGEQVPVYFHHCAADQFIEFGNRVRAFQESIAKKENL